MTDLAWLPDLVPLESHGGNWDAYLDHLYSLFVKDFGGSLPPFRGMPLHLKRYPMHAGKCATFWHFISAGSVEQDRLPDLRRCERIAWPRPMIEEANNLASERVLAWPNQRKNGSAWVLAVPDFSYKVVLADRGEFLLPWTAFTLEHEHERRKSRSEYEAWRRDQKS